MGRAFSACIPQPRLYCGRGTSTWNGIPSTLDIAIHAATLLVEVGLPSSNTGFRAGTCKSESLIGDNLAYPWLIIDSLRV